MRPLQAILPASIGTLVGVFAMHLLAAPAPRAPESPRAVPRPLAPHTDRRVDALEAQVRELERAREAAPAGAAATAAAPQPQLDEDRHASEERFARAFEGRLAEHSRDERDAAWAAAEEEAIARAMPRIAADTGQSFKLVSVDCRSASCAIRLQWPGAAAARGELQRLLDSTAQLGCARQIALPEAEGDVYEASLLLDCPRG